jgi:hypothetical protein
MEFIICSLGLLSLFLLQSLASILAFCFFHITKLQVNLIITDKIKKTDGYHSHQEVLYNIISIIMFLLIQRWYHNDSKHKPNIMHKGVEGVARLFNGST